MYHKFFIQQMSMNGYITTVEWMASSVSFVIKFVLLNCFAK